MNDLHLTVELAEGVTYKKDLIGGRIDKFMLTLDKVVKAYKGINPDRLTLTTDGTVLMEVADKAASSDVIVNTLSSYAIGNLHLDTTAYKDSTGILTNYNFTINPTEFTEFRKGKTNDPVMDLQIADKDFFQVTLASGKVYRVAYDTAVEATATSYAELETYPVLIDELAMSTDDALELKEYKPSDVFKLVFDTDAGILTTSSYYDPEYTSKNGYRTLDLCKKYLQGYETKKVKDSYKPSAISADIRVADKQFDVIYITLTMVNEIYTLKQTFISLDMLG